MELAAPSDQPSTKKGIAFEICYKAPVADRPPQQVLDYTKKIVSPRQLVAKLKRAEDRRQLQEAQRIETLTRHNQRAFEMYLRKLAATEAELQQMRDEQQRSMEAHTERREAKLNNRRNKLQTHSARVEIVQLQKLERLKSFAEHLEQKATASEKKRKANTRALQRRLQKHHEHVEEVRRNRMFPDINDKNRRLSYAWI